MNRGVWTKRFELDVPINRYKERGGSHYTGPFKSFWVSKASSSSFECNLIIDTRNESESGLPLRLNQCMTIGKGTNRKADNGCIEFKTAQAGAWIEITFSMEEEIDVGSVVVETSGAVQVSGGNSYSNDSYAVTDVPSMLLTVDGQRSKAEIYNQTDEAFYVGNQTSINDVNFMQKCIKIKPWNEVPFVWDIPTALYCRKENAGTVNPVILIKNK